MLNRLLRSSSSNLLRRSQTRLVSRINILSRFQSTFLPASPAAVSEYLRRNDMIFSETSSHFRIKECPFCHPIKGKNDNMFKLHIEKDQGLYFCHRCGASGNWITFKSNIQQLSSGISIESLASSRSSRGQTKRSFNPTHYTGNPLPPTAANDSLLIQPLDETKAHNLCHNLKEEPAVLNYLTETRGLTEETLDLYRVGCMQMKDQMWITFPWTAREIDIQMMGSEMFKPVPGDTLNKEENQESTTVKSASQDQNIFSVIRIKARNVENKKQQLLLPKGGSWGLFGWHTISNSATSIVITEGEYDAMAVYQATKMPAISLPNGCQSLPPKILPLLQKFKSIYLWLDNDKPGQDSLERFVHKLGLHRCLIVRPEGSERLPECVTPVGQLPKDANEALLQHWDISRILDSASLLPHDKIATFGELRHEVFQEIQNPMLAAGIQSRFFPSLNDILKGHRRGELTILTGPTGCGKTTFLSQLSLDYCEQNVSTLWGSFEIKNTRLIKKMMTQRAGCALESLSQEHLEHQADEFEQLPLYFMRFFGSTQVDEVLDAMEHAVYALDVQHVILDNVQFMLAGQSRGFDKFDRQDVALDKFRHFATNHKIHLTLVMHPRKEAEDQLLTLSSVFGTAKATQEADNVLILQRTFGKDEDQNGLTLDLKKNRFDGSLGSIPLSFDRESSRLLEKQTSHHNANTSVQRMSSNTERAMLDIETEFALESKTREFQEQRQRRQMQMLETTTILEPILAPKENLKSSSPLPNNELELDERVTLEPYSTFNHIIQR